LGSGKTIAEDKMPDLNAFTTVSSAMRMVAGTARIWE
jgi:ribosomal protein L11